MEPLQKVSGGMRNITPSTHNRASEAEPQRHADRSNPSPLPISGSYNSLFKVLCIFPSRYLYAIGLGLIFSVRRYSPPILALCSQTVRLLVPIYTDSAILLQGSHLLCRCVPANFRAHTKPRSDHKPHFGYSVKSVADSVLRSSRFARSY